MCNRHVSFTMLVSRLVSEQPTNRPLRRLGNKDANLTENNSDMTVTQIKNPDDPRVKRTRKLLHDAFDSLLTEKGFEAITVQDIAERATLNRATFYAHFQDKFDLVDSRIRGQFKDRLESVLPAASPLSAGSLEKLCRTVFDYLAEAYGHCHIDRQFAPLLERAMHETLYAFLLDWLGKRPRRRGSQPAVFDTTAMALSSAIIGVAIQWTRAGRRQAANELAVQLAAVLTDGAGG